MKRRLGFDDDQLRSSMAVMLTFKQVAGSTFGEAMEMAANLSKLLGQDLQSSVLQLGKALEDPETGLTALRRAGVSFNDAQKETIKTLVETGRQAQALHLILDVMRSQGIDKVAESMNRGLAKATNDVGLAWADMLKAFGKSEAVLFLVHGALDTVRRDLEVIEDLAKRDAVREAVSGVIRQPGESPAGARIRQLNTMIGNVREGHVAEAREQFAGMMKPYKSDADQQAEALKKLRQLAPNAELSGGELAAAEAKIREKFSKKGEDPYPQLIKSIREKTAVMQEELNGQEKLTGGQEMALKIMVGLRDGTLKLAEAKRIQLGVDLETMLAQDKALAQRKLQAETNSKLVASIDVVEKARDKENEIVSTAVVHLSEYLQGLEFETSLIGMNDAAKEKAAALRKLDMEQREAEAKLNSKDIDYLKRAIKLQDEYDRKRGQISDALDVKGAREAAHKASEETKAEWKKTNDEIGRGLSDALMRGFESGKDFAANFRDTLVNMFKTTILRPVIQWIVSPISGAITATLGGLGFPGLAGAAGGGGGASGGLGSLFSADGISGMAGALTGGFDAVFQNAGVMMGSQWLADIGNYGLGVPMIGGLAQMMMGNVAGGAGSMIGGGIGSLFGPVGTIIGSAAGSWLGGMFGGGGSGTYATNTGYQLNGSGSIAGGFSGLGYANSTNNGVNYQEVMPGAGGFFTSVNQQLPSMLADFEKLAKIMGIDSSGLAGANLSFNASGASDADTVQNALGKIADQMATQLVPGIKSFQQAGESLSQTLVRLAAASEQLRQQQQQSEGQLRGLVRGMPGALGITALEQYQRTLAVSDTLAPMDRLGAARSQYADLLGRARADDLSAVQAFPGAAQQLLGIGRDAFASGPEFAALMREVNRDLSGVLGHQQELQTDILSGIDVTIQQAAQDQIAEIRRQTNALVEANREIRDELRRLREAA